MKWLCEEVELVVEQQVLMRYTIRKYKDDVFCDVVSMEVGHILLGTPWHVERNLNHHEGTNKISFEHEGHKIVKRDEGDERKIIKRERI